VTEPQNITNFFEYPKNAQIIVTYSNDASSNGNTIVASDSITN
jgi:hypothetical protein